MTDTHKMRCAAPRCAAIRAEGASTLPASSIA
jgi:hypothetical protein